MVTRDLYGDGNHGNSTGFPRGCKLVLRGSCTDGNRYSGTPVGNCSKKCKTTNSALGSKFRGPWKTVVWTRNSFSFSYDANKTVLHFYFNHSIYLANCARQHKLNINKTIYSTVTGYQNSKCSSKLVAQISTKISH